MMNRRMKRLEVNQNGLKLYYAGLPSFTRNFSRDALISGMLMQNSEMLHDQLVFCMQKQGKKQDPITGEEPGKIHHEYPGVFLDSLSTEYNSCDTTALFLISFYEYIRISKDKKFLANNISGILAAVRYILSHIKIKDGYFYDDPKYCGATRFALNSTYWKDAQFFGRNEPDYPVVFLLAHVQNMKALKCASVLLKDKSLLNIVQLMKSKLGLLDWIAYDNIGWIKGISSDFLQALFFLDINDLSKEQLNNVLNMAKKLESIAGYRALDTSFAFVIGKNSYDYPNTVWPFEQALINLGAKKFGLVEVMKVSSRVKDFLNTEPEYLLIKGNIVTKTGCDPQLWTIAAREYFSNIN